MNDGIQITALNIDDIKKAMHQEIDNITPDDWAKFGISFAKDDDTDMFYKHIDIHITKDGCKEE